MRNIVLGLTIAVLGSFTLGCNTDAYCFSCGTPDIADAGNSGGMGGSGGGNGEGGSLFGDGGPGPGSGGGGTGGSGGGCGDTSSDPKNCGSCGNVCDLLGAFPKCVNGMCEVDKCATGFNDLDKNPANGCEYVCAVSNNGVEVCDDKDNNCDGTVDEGFDLNTDPNNCGACGIVCLLPNATAGCSVVNGFPTCVVTACDPGYSNVDNLNVNGCEYTCAVNPPQAEQCNALDDNCNGQINEGNPGGGMPCQSSCPGGVCQGQCTPGTTLCAGSTLICVPGTGPTIETCDAKDNDCDGTVDNGFNLDNDPLNCGACGTVCMLSNAIGGCQM
ncbi:MAG TPA: MopE-related protein, partial [Polyangium sp.]|nr:MopE-related protein [Polyangium sp.]